MSFETHLNALSKMNSRYDRSEYLETLRERFAEFLLTEVETLSEASYSKADLVTIIEGSVQSEPYLNVISILGQKQRPELRDRAYEFGVLAFNSGKCVQYIQLLAPFISPDDADQMLGMAGQYPMWFLNYRGEVIESDAVKSTQWKLDFINAAYGDDSEAKTAFASIFKFYSDSDALKSVTSETVRERAQSRCKGRMAFKYLSEEVLDRLSDGSRNNFLEALVSSKTDYNDWPRIDALLKKYDFKLWNIGSIRSEETISYIKDEVSRSNNVAWLLNVIGSTRYAASRGELRALLNDALLRNLGEIRPETITSDQALAISNRVVIKSLFDHLEGKAQKYLARNYWLEEDEGSGDLVAEGQKSYDWMFIEEHADDLVSSWGDYLVPNIDISRLKWLWGIVSHDTAKRSLLNHISIRITGNISKSERAEFLELYSEFLAQDVNKYDRAESISYSWESGYYGESDTGCTNMALDLWSNLGPRIRDHIAETVNYSFSLDYFNPSAENERLLTHLSEHSLEKLVYHDESKLPLLSYLNDQSVVASLPAVMERLEKSAASVKHLARGLAKVSAELVNGQGLYTYSKKNIRDAAQWGLMQSNRDDAPSVITQLLGDKKAKLDDAKRSHYLDALERHTIDGSEVLRLTPWAKESLAEYSTSNLTATLRKKLSRLWSEDLKDDWGDAPEILEYALCVMASDSWGGVPKFTRDCFATVSEIKRQQITDAIIEAWSTGKADKADFWVLDLLKEYSGENSVPILQKLVINWHKQYRLRAAAVVTAMGNMDTSFALNSCDEFYQKSKYSDDVRTAALSALKAAAERRGISLTELYDELVPTFGLSSEGLELNTGTRKFLVKLRATLDLDVIDVESGRAYKNLPKAKADEDPTLRLEAETKFKLLKKNVKPMVKGLATRFNNAFDVGLEWKSDRWQSLFVNHPILSLLGQGFVWSVTDKEQSRLFRISEDLSLVDVEDEPVTFEEGVVSLMHPALIGADECEVWRTCFDDYEITSFIPQFTSSNLTSVEYDADKDSFDLFLKTSCDYGTFKRIMQNNNYEVSDGDGSWVASYSRRYQNTPWSIEINLEECRSYMSHDEEVIFGGIEFYKSREKLTLAEVPPRLMSTVVTLMEKLTGK